MRKIKIIWDILSVIFLKKFYCERCENCGEGWKIYLNKWRHCEELSVISPNLEIWNNYPNNISSLSVLMLGLQI